MSTQSVTTRPAPLGAITTFHVTQAVERAFLGFVAWRRARATEKALLKLSDKQLADVGLHRGEIVSLAEDLARG